MSVALAGSAKEQGLVQFRLVQCERTAQNYLGHSMESALTSSDFQQRLLARLDTPKLPMPNKHFQDQSWLNTWRY